MASIHTSGFEVGQEVVAMSFPGVPCQCNSEFSPEHPCRVRIEKVGRTKVHGRMSGGRLVAMTVPSLPDARGLIAYPVQEAKGLYGFKLLKHGHTAENTRRLVESL